MNLLITGGAGFIGSNLARYWCTEHPGDAVVVVDALTYAGNRASLSDLEGQIAFVRGSIGDVDVMETTLSHHSIDVVVNCAAESHNSYAVVNPAVFFRTNVVETQGLCEAARRAGVARLHHVSTCEVYGDLDLDTDELFTESSPYRPRTPYNASKAGGDHVVRSYYETFGLPITITNCANNYGAYQFPEKVIPLFATNALDDRPLPLYASTKHRREWVHVLDHCRAIDLVIGSGRVGETYHVGTGVERNVEEIADAVLNALGKPASLKQTVPDRPGHDRRYALDWSKIRTELGWEPTYGFDAGLIDTVRWYADHRDWWQPLRERAPVQEDRAMGLTLVTGGAGQVARALAGDDTLLLDHAALDITDADAVTAALTAHRPTAVIHCAALTNVDACESEPDRAFLVNATGTRNVVDAAHAVGAYVVTLSTDYVFDGAKGEPYVEDDPTNPLSVYGRSKVAGEGLADATVRTSWVRGPMIEWLLTTDEPLRFVTDQRSNPTLPDDLATKLRWFTGERPTGIWHVTNQGAVTAYEFARAVLEAAGRDPNRVEPITTVELNRPAPRPPYSALANQRLQDAGEALLPDFRESLKRLLRR